MSKGDVIHVALAFCDPKGTYARHASVVIVSLFENTSSNVCLHIIHDDTLTRYNRDVFEQTAEKYGSKLNFINVESLLGGTSIDISKLTLDGERGTLFRLLIPNLIKEDKLLYLDCDLIVNLDIAELWDIDLAGHALAAVRDTCSLAYLEGSPISWRYKMIWNLMNVKPDSYFNAGVILMNLKKIRTEYCFLKNVESFYDKFKKCITLADQDCLNYVFSGDVLYVDGKFNRMDTDKYADNVSKSIWHMAGVSKPWTMCSVGSVDELYWHYLSRTAYCSNSDEFISLMVSMLASSPFIHRHSSNCIKRLKRQMLDNIFRSHIWTVPPMLIMMLRKNVK